MSEFYADQPGVQPTSDPDILQVTTAVIDEIPEEAELLRQRDILWKLLAWCRTEAGFWPGFGRDDMEDNDLPNMLKVINAALEETAP